MFQQYPPMHKKDMKTQIQKLKSAHELFGELFTIANGII